MKHNFAAHLRPNINQELSLLAHWIIHEAAVAANLIGRSKSLFPEEAALCTSLFFHTRPFELDSYIR